MGLKERLESDLKAAMKSKNMAVVGTLRMVLSAIRNREIEERGAGQLKIDESLSDAGVIKVLQTFSKQRQESIDMFKKGGRNDLAEKEEKELVYVKQYLPLQLSEAEIERVVLEVISEAKACGPKDIGNVMRLVMPRLTGQAHGKLINEIVRRKLTA